MDLTDDERRLMAELLDKVQRQKLKSFNNPRDRRTARELERKLDDIKTPVGPPPASWDR